jgi:hypothetical protein
MRTFSVRVNTNLADVDASIPLSKCMSVAQLGDDCNGVQASVFCQSVGDDLESVCVCLEAIGLHSLEGVSVLREQSGYVDFGCTTTSNQRPKMTLVKVAMQKRSKGLPLLHQATDNTESIVDTSLAFFDDKVVGSHGEDADRSSPILYACNTHDLDIVIVPLFDEIGITKLVLCEMFDIGDGFASKRFRKERDFIPLHILHDKDIQALKEVECDVVDGITKDGLLDQENIAVGLLDLFAHVEEVLTTFFDHLVHLSVVVNDDGVVHLMTHLLEV